MESIDNAMFHSIRQKLGVARKEACRDDDTVTTMDPSSTHTLATLVEEEETLEEEESVNAKWVWEAGATSDDEDDKRWIGTESCQVVDRSSVSRR